MSERNEQDWVLLHESGELDETAQLSDALARDEALVDYTHDVRRLEALGREALTVDGPSDDLVAAVLREAASEVDLKPLPMSRVFVKVLAYAATLMLALGLWQFHDREQQAARVGEMQALLSLGATDNATTDHVASEDEDDLQALALMLLEMEGLAYEEEAQADYDISEETITQPVSLRPRATQGHNTLAFHARKYG